MERVKRTILTCAAHLNVKVPSQGSLHPTPLKSQRIHSATKVHSPSIPRRPLSTMTTPQFQHGSMEPKKEKGPDSRSLIPNIFGKTYNQFLSPYLDFFPLLLKGKACPNNKLCFKLNNNSQYAGWCGGKAHPGGHEARKEHGSDQQDFDIFALPTEHVGTLCLTTLPHSLHHAQRTHPLTHPTPGM